MSDKPDNHNEFNLNNLDEFNEVLNNNTDDSPIEPSPNVKKEPELFSDQLDPANSESRDQVAFDPLIARKHDETAAKASAGNPDSKQDSYASLITLPNLLATTAMLLSSIAIVMHLSTPESPVDNQQIIEDIKTSNQQIHELQRQIEKRLLSLEAQQESLLHSLQMQTKRIDRKMMTATSSPAMKVKKPTTSGSAALPSSGGWAVNLMSVDSREAAEKEKKRLNTLNIQAEIAPFYINKVLKFRIRISGFDERKEAEAFKAELATKHGIKDAWIYKP